MSLLTASLLLPALGGCSQGEPMGRANVVMRFDDVRSQSEQERIEQVITRHAVPGSVSAASSGSGMRVSFQVEQWAALDAMHPQLMYTNRGAMFWSRRDRKLLPGVPSVEMRYEAGELRAAIDTVVRFRVTPGSDVEYRWRGRPPVQVDPRDVRDGQVTLSIELEPDERYLYVRSVRRGLERFLRINVFTKEVERIDREDYPR